MTSSNNADITVVLTDENKITNKPWHTYINVARGAERITLISSGIEVIS